MDDEVIQVFAGAAQRAALYLTDMTPPEEFGGHRITDVYCNFGNISTDGYCAAIAYTDRVAYSAGAQGLESSNESLLTPVSLPYNSPTSYNGVQRGARTAKPSGPTEKPMVRRLPRAKA